MNHSVTKRAQRVPIPSIAELTLPLLRLLGDGREITLTEATHQVADALELTDEQRSQRIPSGGSTMLYTRMGMVVYSLRHASLIEDAGERRFRVSELGLGVLADPPTIIDSRYLKQYTDKVRQPRRTRGSNGDGRRRQRTALKWPVKAETTATGEVVFSHPPLPLVPVEDHPRAFFESVLRLRALVQEHPQISHQRLYDALCDWADQPATGGAQAAFDAWYAAGVVARRSYVLDALHPVRVTLPPDAPLHDLRRHCLISLCRRVKNMPELLALVARLPYPSTGDLADILGEDEAYTTLRLRLLLAFEAVSEAGDGWQVTQLGAEALKEVPAREVALAETPKADVDPNPADDGVDLLDWLPEPEPEGAPTSGRGRTSQRPEQTPELADDDDTPLSVRTALSVGFTATERSDVASTEVTQGDIQPAQVAGQGTYSRVDAHMRTSLLEGLGILLPTNDKLGNLVREHSWRNPQYVGTAPDGAVVAWKGWSANLRPHYPTYHTAYIDLVENALLPSLRIVLFGPRFADRIKNLREYVVVFVGGFPALYVNRISAAGFVPRIMGRTAHACYVTSVDEFLWNSTLHWAGGIAKLLNFQRDVLGSQFELPPIV